MQKNKLKQTWIKQPQLFNSSKYPTLNQLENVRVAGETTTKGITLISLIITIIVMLVLAGVAISLTLGQNGIFKTAKQAVKNYTDEQNKELATLNQFNNEISSIISGDKKEEIKKSLPNKPILLTGMTPIRFTEPTDTVEGKVQFQATGEEWTSAEWYDYEHQKWANTRTTDGSMWVWIPRYAYRINSSTQTCDVVFLIGSTDNYYDENGQIQTAKRQTKIGETIDTSTGYTVHPAFTDESSINFANGGWDKELTGLWVAKFEAGYAGGNNTATKGASSNVNYTQTTAWVPVRETEETGVGTREMPARNWTDGVYGENVTAIKYPTFQGLTYSMNYINHNDAFNISKALVGSGNIYGLSSKLADSHLMKNSEWGAVAYLSQSRYGLNGSNIYINNVGIDYSITSVYAVTGCCGKTADEAKVNTTIDEINNRTADCYVWMQKEGQKASTTGTIYGIYDMSGGTAERMASYVENGHDNLKIYGASITYNGDILKLENTKYTMVYKHDSTKDNISIENIGENMNIAMAANYLKNTKRYGDAIRETSTEGKGGTSWYSDVSYFPGLNTPFFSRNGYVQDNIFSGLFHFSRSVGESSCLDGFRPVLIAL